MIRIGTSGWNYPTGKGTWNGIFYPEGAPKDRIATYAEGRATDPDGNLIDISTTGWGPVRRNDL